MSKAAIKIGVSILSLITLSLFSAYYILPALAIQIPGEGPFRNETGQLMPVWVNMTNHTDMFFVNGQRVYITANFSCSNPDANESCNASMTTFANFSEIGGSSERRGVWLTNSPDASWALFEFNDTINLNNIEMIQPRMVYVNATTKNGTASPPGLRAPVLVVNMSTFGCPPEGDPNIQFPVVPGWNISSQQPVPPPGVKAVGCTQNSTLCQNMDLYGPGTWDDVNQSWKVCAPKFGGATTNLTAIAESGNMSAIQNFTIEVPGKGKIVFNENVSFASRSEASAIMEFAMKSVMTGGKIGMNESEWNGQAGRPILNLSARLTIYNVSQYLGPITGFPQIIRTAYGNPLSAGSTCPPNLCSDFVWDGENMTFTVSTFSDYGVSDDINITLESPANFSYSNTRNVNFTFTPIWNASVMKNCTLYGNFTNGWSANTSNTTPLVNGTINGINNTVNADGSYLWNIYCFDIGTGYDYGSINWTVIVDTVAPQISITSPTASTYGSSSITFAYTASDSGSGISSCSYTLDSGSATSAGTSVSTTLTLLDGKHTLSVTCTDNAGNSGSASVTFSISTGGVSSPSVSSPSPETTKIIIPRIAAGAEKTIKITKGEHGVTEVTVTVKNSVASVFIDVAKLPGKPASIDKEVTGKVYHYLEINKTNIKDEDIDKIKIKFSVKKSWIEENNISADTVALNRFTTQWDKLPTAKVGETADEIEYEAESPGLSYFVISGEVKAAPEQVPEEVTEEVPAEEKEEIPPEKDYTLVYAAVVIILIAGAYFAFFKGKPKKKK